MIKQVLENHGVVTLVFTQMMGSNIDVFTRIGFGLIPGHQDRAESVHEKLGLVGDKGGLYIGHNPVKPEYFLRRLSGCVILCFAGAQGNRGLIFRSPRSWYGK